MIGKPVSRVPGATLSRPVGALTHPFLAGQALAGPANLRAPRLFTRCLVKNPSLLGRGRAINHTPRETTTYRLDVRGQSWALLSKEEVSFVSSVSVRRARDFDSNQNHRLMVRSPVKWICEVNFFLKIV